MVVVTQLWLNVQSGEKIRAIFTYSVVALLGVCLCFRGSGDIFIRLLPAALKLPPLAFGNSGISAILLDKMPMLPSTTPKYLTLYFGPM